MDWTPNLGRVVIGMPEGWAFTFGVLGAHFYRNQRKI